jgi:NAD(P)-dependent dehydrogenase (short-subunit alcohol dehydrogenase family)
MIARGLLDAGATVLIAARSEDQLRDTAARLGPNCTPLVADLSTPQGCEGLAESVSAETDQLHILVNNAGATHMADFNEPPGDDWNRVMAVNVSAPQHLTVALRPLLSSSASEADPSRVIVIGSTSGLVLSGLPDPAYEASKAAMHHLARHQAAELVGENILVNVIAPGLFPTRMSAFLQEPALRDPVLGTIPMKRAGQPEEIAGAAVFLASRAGGYVTGQILAVDGGRTGIGRADPVSGLGREAE